MKKKKKKTVSTASPWPGCGRVMVPNEGSKASVLLWGDSPPPNSRGLLTIPTDFLLVTTGGRVLLSSRARGQGCC